MKGSQVKKCRACGEIFPTEPLLKQHYKLHRTADGKKFQCPLCASTFLRMDKLGQHMQRKHFGVYNNEEVRASDNGHVAPHIASSVKGNGQVAAPVFQSVQDNGQAAAVVGQSVHKEIPVKKFKCDICDSAFNRHEKLRRHVYSHRNINDKFRYCRICDTHLPSFLKLKQHYLLHKTADGKKFACPSCERTYTRLERLCDHLPSHKKTRKGRKIRCRVCRKNFTNFRQLHRHYAIHKTENGKEFKCPRCHDVFDTLEKIAYHMPLHSRPSKCRACHKTFENVYKMSRHYRLRHAVKYGPLNKHLHVARIELDHSYAKKA